MSDIMNSKPHIVIVILTFAIAALSVAAGVPKILQMPQELGFLRALGFSGISVTLLGVVQLAGGLLLIWRKTRITGAALAGIAFLVSSTAILVGGNTTFALASLLPVALLIVVIYGNLRVAGSDNAK